MLKKGTEDIIRLLLDFQKPITIKELAERLHMSEKTVWNRINAKNLDAMLGSDVILVRKTNVGMYLDGTKDALDSLRHKLNGAVQHPAFQEEYRRNNVMMQLLKADVPLPIQELSQTYLVSRKTMLQDLDCLQQQLHQYQLQLIRKQNAGVSITGDEISRRQLLERTILHQSVYYKDSHHKSIVFDEGVARVLQDIAFDVYLENAISLVKEIQKELVGKFTDEGSKEIILQILISSHRSGQGSYINRIHEDPCEMNLHFQEFIQLFERNHMLLHHNDYIYLWRRCINNRFVKTDAKKVDDKYLILARELLSSVVDLQASEEIDYLIKNLAFHICQAVKRSNIGIKVNNPVLNKIKQQYGKFYSMVLTNVTQFEKSYNISLNEDEIGFITIYICAIYEKNISNQYYKVLLVSDEGVGQTQLLSMQVMNHFHNLLIHDTCNSLMLNEHKLEDCDFIISTCSLLLKHEYMEKLIRISNFIGEDDIQHISEQILRVGSQRLQKKVKQEPYDAIDFKYFESHQRSREEIFTTYLSRAEQFGYCDHIYMQTVFEREQRASTSIGKRIAIPHGDDAHIMKPAVFIVRNDVPVDWGNEQVDIVLFLILKFTDIQQNKRFFMRLYSCIEKSELIRTIDGPEKLDILKHYIMEGGNG